MSTRLKAVLPLTLSIGLLAFLASEVALNFTFHWVAYNLPGVGFDLPKNFQLILPVAFISWGLFFAAGGDNAATTFSGVSSGSGGVTKEGTRTFTLSGLNTYSGATTISAGSLRLGLADALAAVARMGERFGEAELYRLKGELLLRAGPQLPASEVVPPDAPRPLPDTAAEACFHDAIVIARRQQAKVWELRAVRSLSRLWQQQGKRQAAYELLAPIYDWFTEGFDTMDLQEAKALLDDLS